MNTRSLVVPAGTFLLAILLSIAVSPAPRLSARAAQSMTGGGGCATQLDIPEKPTWLPRGNEGGDEKSMGNAIRARVKWEPTGGGVTTERRKFEVRLGGPPALKGICDNKGKESFPDYTLEASDNPKWEIADGVPPYPGAQNMSAVTKDAYPHGVWVDILIRSYDFGAWTRVFANAVGCPEVNDRIPLDTDDDSLPDRWEGGKGFYDEQGKFLVYNIASPTTYKGERDGDSDRDGGFVPLSHRNNHVHVEPAKVHDEPGDGFTAFEEYRGVFAQGKFYRMNELLNDAGPEVPSSHRGTAMKNVFICDDHGWINDRGLALREHGVQFHRIKFEEMSSEIFNNEADTAGYVDDNSASRSQRAIDLVKRDIKGYGYSNGFSINGEPLSILINETRITRDADDINYVLRVPRRVTDLAAYRFKRIDREELLNYTIAHEVGHKLSLKHNEHPLEYGPSPSVYNNKVWWLDANPSRILTWTLAEFFGRDSEGNLVLNYNILETLAGDNQPQGNLVIPFDSNLIFDGHDGFQHAPMKRTYDFGGAPVVGPFPYWHHTGTLMDAHPEYKALKPRLPADQRKKILLK